MTARLGKAALVSICSTWMVACGPGDRLEQLPAALDPRAPDECLAWPAAEGFHKDVFVDGGYGLTPLMPTFVEHLCLEADALLLGNPEEGGTEAMIAMQNEMLVGNPDDLNGILLYPDGAPRYRAIFANGGVSNSHGESLGEEGRERFRTFYQNGGSYTGSCAGAYLATSGNASNHDAPYLGLWPGVVEGSGVGTQYHSVTFENMDHPIVQKFPSLSEDGVVKNVKYVGGPIFDGPHGTWAQGTEVIARVDVSGYAMGYLHNQSPEKTKIWDASISIIAYQPEPGSGRLVLNSSHPEYAEKGEVLDLMSAVMLHTLEGTRAPSVKGTLANDQPVEAVIGDRQYHRWLIDVPGEAELLTCTVEGSDGELALYLNPGCPASRPEHQHLSEGPAPEIVVEKPTPGQWHLSVQGLHDVKNGVPYGLAVRWQ